MSAEAKTAGAVLVLAAAAALLSAQAGKARASGGPALRPVTLSAILSSRMFSVVNRNDLLAAMKAWLELAGKDRGLAIEARMETADSPAEMRRRLLEGSVDLLLLEITDYLQLERAGLVRPELLGIRAGTQSPHYPYVLLVRPDSGVQDLAGLRGKVVHHYSNLRSNTSAAWMELLLAKGKFGPPSSFFEAVKAVSRPQDCILTVFFGRVDGCIVDEVSLNVLKELNPQLGKLRVMARSVPLVDIVVAVPAKPRPHRDEMLEAIVGLHLHPRGKQLLMVFRTERSVVIRPGDLDSTRAFWKERDALKAASGQGGAP